MSESATTSDSTTRLNTLIETIKEINDDKKRPPTVRELATELGRTVSGVHKDLYTLRTAGRVEWEERKPRTLRIVRRKR